jgi:hypothetical protein
LWTTKLLGAFDAVLFGVQLADRDRVTGSQFLQHPAKGGTEKWPKK